MFCSCIECVACSSTAVNQSNRSAEIFALNRGWREPGRLEHHGIGNDICCAARLVGLSTVVVQFHVARCSRIKLKGSQQIPFATIRRLIHVDFFRCACIVMDGISHIPRSVLVGICHPPGIDVVGVSRRQVWSPCGCAVPSRVSTVADLSLSRHVPEGISILIGVSPPICPLLIGLTIRRSA